LKEPVQKGHDHRAGLKRLRVLGKPYEAIDFLLLFDQAKRMAGT